MKTSGIIYYHDWDKHASRITHHVSRIEPKRSINKRNSGSLTRILGIGMLALAVGGISAPMIPRLRLETQYHLAQAKSSLQGETLEPQKMAIPAVFNPLKQQDGTLIEPVSREFGLIIPKIGVNARIIPNVNPTKEKDYAAALKNGIAHSSFSYMPDEEGTVYLFSHSTNYDWFVQDLNAVFYLLKNLEIDDTAVISYNDTLYTYKITDKRVVKPTDIEYLLPEQSGHSLILQTCWPPGSVSERLLIFADLVSDSGESI